MCTVHMYRCVQYICTVFHTQQTVWREVFSVTKTTELRGCDVWDVFIEIENHIVCRRSSIRHKRDKNIQLVTIRRDFYCKNKKKLTYQKLFETFKVLSGKIFCKLHVGFSDFGFCSIQPPFSSAHICKYFQNSANIFCNVVD